MIEIQGTVSSIVFYNKENGYIVMTLDAEEDRVTAVGNISSCGVGRNYILIGDFSVHATYGEQFVFKESREVMPSTEKGISGFLASGVIKGIGPKAALAIVGKFGKETFDIIEKTPERLIQVPGIGMKKAESIAEAFSAHRQLAEITMYLQQFEINPSYTAMLYREYGEDTIEFIKDNPYRLAIEISGIGFKKADLIASKMGIPLEDDNRIKSGILYMLSHFISDGHTFAPRRLLREKSAELLEISGEMVDDKMVEMAFAGEIRIENLEGREAVFIMDYYVAEQTVTKCIKTLCSAVIKPTSGDVASLISATERDIGISFSKEQRQAVESCMNQAVTVITGGPGTGKTTIINGILSILEHNGFVTVVGAPTGRAAKKITETTGHEASTIHRMLEYKYQEDMDSMYFAINAENPLECDAVIIDESSMVDLLLMQALVKAIKPGTRLVLVGDGDQLPSVGAGNVLSDILQSEYVYSIRLKEIFRQAQESMIVINAHRINRGEYPELNQLDKDFFLVRRSSEKDMVDTILNLCADKLPRHYLECNPLRDIQVLTPVRKGTLGILQMNKELQAKINPPAEDKAEKHYGNKCFRVGDKVMQIKNNYTMKWKKVGDFEGGEGVFNGELGYVQSIDEDFGEMTVVFDENKYVKYEFGQLDQLETAYAITVHKSQGSEFPIVVMPISWFPPMLATRNLLYTAVTRGKLAVILVGSEQKIQAIVDNNRITERYSGLKARLSGLMEERE